jgi:hypothetical protein
MAKWLLIVPLLVAGCAASPSAKTARNFNRAAVQLQRQSDADSLAAAGLFNAVKNRRQAIVLLARAEAAEPTRADLVWLYLQVCHKEPSCDPQPEELRLRTLSPGNGAGWLGTLARATVAKDDAARDAALSAIGRSARVDIYWTTLIGHLSIAVAQTGKISLADAMTTVTGIVAAMAIPAYQPASNSCKGDRLQRADILDACRGVAAAFEQGDTVITEMMGVAIAKRVWPQGSAEWQAATERRRVYDYRAALWRPFDAAPWPSARTKKYLELCLDNRREQDVLRAQLTDLGKVADPPASE